MCTSSLSKRWKKNELPLRVESTLKNCHLLYTENSFPRVLYILLNILNIYFTRFLLNIDLIPTHMYEFTATIIVTPLLPTTKAMRIQQIFRYMHKVFALHRNVCTLLELLETFLIPLTLSLIIIAFYQRRKNSLRQHLSTCESSF